MVYCHMYIHMGINTATCNELVNRRTHDAIYISLIPDLCGPYQVLSQREKTLQLVVRSKPVIMSDVRVKPDYVLNETNCGSTTFNLSASATSAIAPPATQPPATQTTRSGRYVRFPACFNTYTTFPAVGVGRGDVGTSQKAVLLRVHLPVTCCLAN
jgi:hypothetical protein